MVLLTTNTPLYVVYDRAPRQIVSTTGSDALQTTTNLPQQMIDYNQATYYQLDAWNLAGAPNTAVLIIDYSQVFWNVQFSLLCWLGGKGASFNIHSYIDYSTDGITWTNLLTDNFGDIAYKNIFLNFRYLRITQQVGTYGASVAAQIKVYEHHLLGSG